MESNIGPFTEGRDIPWLQDNADVDWWRAWNVTYRDVIILDANGELGEVYNLTSNDLGDTEKYIELKSLMLDVAQGG